MASQEHTQSPREIPAEKPCSKCKLTKSIDYFHKNKARNDGLQGKCKPCAIAAVKAWRKDNPEKENARSRRWRKNNPESSHKIHRRYMERNSEKKYARNAIQGAVKCGKITRPDSCSRCDMKCTPDAHHWSYKREHWLDVIWICRPCHRKIHSSVKG